MTAQRESPMRKQEGSPSLYSFKNPEKLTIKQKLLQEVAPLIETERSNCGRAKLGRRNNSVTPHHGINHASQESSHF